MVTPRETTYKLKKAVEINFLDRWENEGYVQRRPHELGGKLVLEKAIGEAFIARRNIRVERYKVGGTAVALVKAFGWDLLENATHIRIRGGRVLPITRADKRVVLSEKPGKGITDIKAGEVIRVDLLGARVDRIPVVKVDMSCYVKGEYTPRDKRTPTRTIRINGTTTIKVGSRMPEGVDFWDEIYTELRHSLLNESSTDYRVRSFGTGAEDWWTYFTWTPSVETSENDMISEASRKGG